MQFSLDRKQRRHKHNQCSASDSVGLIFTISYCSTLLITTPTTTPSLLKTSLNEEWKECVTSQKGLRRMYGLLTKCDVKMAGYWPSSFFACLWTESRFIMVTSVSILVTILIEICRGYNLGVALHGMEIVDTLSNI